MTMRAVVVHTSGSIDAVGVSDWPVPQPTVGEVRLRVRAAALNRADLGLVLGLTGPGLRPRQLPMIPGVDLAGVIDAVGADVTDWQPGDRVVAYPGVFCGRCRACQRGEESMCERYQILGEERHGGFAEYVTVPAQNLLRVPSGVPWDVVAAAPVAATTAWRMVFTAAGLRPSQRVLVVGVGSGVSTMAVSLARRVGARVFATTRREDKVAKALSLGAESVRVGYDTPFDAWVDEVTDGEGVDVVVDSVGAATWRQSIRSLTPGGALVVCGASSGDDPSFSIRELYQAHRRVLGAPLGNRRDFRAVMDLVFRGEVVPTIDARYTLDDLPTALTRLRDGDAFGKLVVIP